MKIKYLALSAFLITADSGTRIITDPYTVGDDFKHDEIAESADIVTVSHEHADHNNVAAIQGNPRVFRETGEAKGIKVRAIHAYHDDTRGSWLGTNTIFCIEVDGINICHCGDLGHLPDAGQTAEIGRVDILMVPVGGHCCLDGVKATRLGDQLRPRVIIPMHYYTDKNFFPFKVKSVEEFLEGKSNVTRLDVSEIEFNKGKLPDETQIMVFKTSR